MKTNDEDGKYKYSRIVKADINAVASIIYPNPAKETIYVQTAGGTSDQTVLLLTDLKGKVFMQKNLHADATMLSNTFNVSHLPAGMYYLKIIKDGKTEVKSFVKE